MTDKDKAVSASIKLLSAVDWWIDVWCCIDHRSREKVLAGLQEYRIVLEQLVDCANNWGSDSFSGRGMFLLIGRLRIICSRDSLKSLTVPRNSDDQLKEINKNNKIIVSNCLTILVDELYIPYIKRILEEKAIKEHPCFPKCEG